MEDCVVTTQINGIKYHTYYSKDGIIVAERYKPMDGENGVESWIRNGKFHRNDGPATIQYYNGQKVKECWYRNSKLHRDDGPAVINYEDGQIIGEYWYRHGKLHREDGPAEIWYDDGQIIYESWYRNGITYRIGQLASMVYRNIDSVVCYWDDTSYAQNIDEFRDIVKGDAIHDALRPLPIPIRDAIIPHYCYQ